MTDSRITIILDDRGRVHVRMGSFGVVTFRSRRKAAAVGRELLELVHESTRTGRMISLEIGGSKVGFTRLDEARQVEPG